MQSWSLVGRKQTLEGRSGSDNRGKGFESYCYLRVL